ncbi:hypothetical protein BpHYR1_047801 [Brachionus plicatilis]|uniref:Uncharacterized protein n=1 Tax=Brachionus plicatilis TaxID=10195 RepID=A0A3M7PF23_BRAPC|nr:hypothetical protein BpHYR1_047801 [Brachionus plicatilis]
MQKYENTRSEKKRVITPKSRIRSVSHLSNLRYPLLAAKHARSILNARGNPFNKNGRAFKSWETSKILVNLELCSWSLDFMYQSVIAITAELGFVPRNMGISTEINSCFNLFHKELSCNRPRISKSGH